MKVPRKLDKIVGKGRHGDTAIVFDPDDIAPGEILIGSALQLRELRNVVRRTAGLVSTQGPVKEQMGSGWRADIDNRIITWRPTWSDGKIIDEDGILFLITHEASHLNYTGGYEWPTGLRRKDYGRFHRFVNSVEDIRIERLACKEFPGFRPLRRKVALDLLTAHAEKIAGYALLDQVWLAFHCREFNVPIALPARAQKIVDKFWPLYSRAANLASTDEAAQAIWPIFQVIQGELAADAIEGEKEPQTGDPSEAGEGDGQDGDGEADGEPTESDSEGSGSGGKGEAGDDDDDAQEGSEGGDEGDGEGSESGGQAGTGDGPTKPGQDGPSDRPVRSSHDEADDNRPGQEGNPYEDGQAIEKGMAEDAVSADAKDALTEKIRKEGHEQARADRRKQTLYGGDNEWRNQPVSFSDEAVWGYHETTVKPFIGPLARRLGMVLRNNAMDAYENGHKRGKLNTRLAYRATAGNPRIFRKRTAVGAKDYTFALLLDVSGSMTNEIEKLLRTTIMVGTAFERVGIKTIIIPWHSTLMGIKRAQDPIASAKGFLVNSMSHARGGTTEINALVAAQDELSKVKGLRFLITVTDGQTNFPEQSTLVMRELEDDGVFSVGIGIGMPPPAHYKHGLSVASVADLAIELPRLIGNLVKKGQTA